MTKYLNSFVSTFLHKRNLYSEALSILFRFLVGAVLTSIIIYSVLQLAEDYQVWLNQFENGRVYKFVSFSLITIISAIALYFLFHSRSQRTTQKEDTLDPNLLLHNFIDGFLEGLVTNNNQNKKFKEQAQNQSSYYPDLAPRVRF